MSVKWQGLAGPDQTGKLNSYAVPHYVRHRLEKLAYQYGLANAKTLSLPDFLCAGFRKTGTTWLFENLHRHPDIYLPPYKNVRYFSQAFDQPLATYAAHFKGGENKLKGDFSNSYSSVSDRRIHFIHTVMPNAKLIFLLRNPVERAWSEFVHNTVLQERPLSSFSKEEIESRLRKGTVEVAGGYTELLEKWDHSYPREQIFTGFYEDLDSDPKTLLSDIFTFLGVTTDVDWSRFPFQDCIIPPAGKAYENHDNWRGVIAPRHQNTTELLPDEYKDFLLDYLEPELLRLERRFGPKVSHWRA